MKYLITLVIFFFTTITFAQKISYTQWKEDAKTDIRLLPKYGNAPKTKEQNEADQELIKAYLAQLGTHRKASDVLVKRGFDYLAKNDLKTAMSRFNQAWLLDPQNENVFWGFGSIYFSFADFGKGMEQYNEGLKLNPKSSNLLTDKATIYMTNYMNNNKEEDFNLALKFFKQSYSIDPNNQNTLFKMSVCYFVKDDCSNALKYYNECQKLGGRPITEEYTQALMQKCKK